MWTPRRAPGRLDRAGAFGLPTRLVSRSPLFSRSSVNGVPSPRFAKPSYAGSNPVLTSDATSSAPGPCFHRRRCVFVRLSGWRSRRLADRLAGRLLSRPTTHGLCAVVSCRPVLQAGARRRPGRQHRLSLRADARSLCRKSDLRLHDRSHARGLLRGRHRLHRMLRRRRHADRALPDALRPALALAHAYAQGWTLPLAPTEGQRGVREIEDRTFVAQFHVAKGHWRSSWSTSLMSEPERACRAFCRVDQVRVPASPRAHGRAASSSCRA
jgi:hypothetical protein